MKVTNKELIEIENKLTTIINDLFALRHRLRLYGYENEKEEVKK